MKEKSSVTTKRWRDNPRAFYIQNRILGSSEKRWYNTYDNYNIFADESQAKSAIAMARISQIMANDERFGGAITAKEWKNEDIQKFVIKCECKTPSVIDFYAEWTFTTKDFLAFHTRAQARLFIDENEDLLKDYFMV